MIKKLLLRFLFLFLIIIISNPITNSIQIIQPNNYSSYESKKIFVDDDNIDGPWDGSIDHPFRFIRDGINFSSNGNTIYVLNGIYFENIILNKSIILLGENKNLTIIDGFYNEYILKINANNISIKNFTLRNSGGFINNSGIKINSNNNYIENCIIYRTKTGIYVYNGLNNSIKKCIFHTNGNGIYLNSSNYTQISECYFSHNSLGLNIEKSKKNKIQNSYANTNGIGFFINNSIDIDITKCALYDNNDNQGGIFLNDCSGILVFNSIIRHNGFGIDIESCQKVNISKTNLYLNSHTGIYIEKDSKDIYIYRSNIFNNSRFGIYIVESNCYLIKNNLYNSLFGVYLEKSNCDLRNNWWGSKRGPAFFEKENDDRLFYKDSIVQFYPWLFNKIDKCGSDWKIDFNLYFYEINNSQFDFIELSGFDNDNDYIPDWWEEKWGYNPLIWNDHKNLDPDGDSLNNIQECYTDKWGSNPFYKDIFLEFDWSKTIDINFTNKPSKKLISKMISAFDKHNISLHVDDGCFGGGEEILQINNFSFSDLSDLYWIYFLHNNLSNPRKNIFHYCLVCDYGPASGFAFFGWNSLDSFLISAQILQNNQPPYFSRDRLIIGGSIHELGHTLGLFVDDHGGNDNRIATWPFTYQWWKYLSYRSCMNYWYTYKIINFSEGSKGKNDFNDWQNMDLNFFKETSFD